MTMPIDSDSWETPDELYNKLDEEFHFDLDAAASYHNHKCEKFFGHYYPGEDNFIDSLQQPWAAVANCVWLNPPYSRGNIDAFMEKVYEQSKSGITIVTLTRFDTTTDWFKKYVDGVADEVRMLAHRVRFKGAGSCYNFPCCVSVFNGLTGMVPSKHHGRDYYIWSWK